MSRFHRTSNAVGLDFAFESPNDEIKDVVLAIHDRQQKNIESSQQLLDTLPINSTEASRSMLEEVNKEFTTNVDNIAQALQKGELSNADAQREIMSQRNKMRESFSTGKLKAINENYSDYKEKESHIKSLFKDTPSVMNYRLNQLRENVDKVEFNNEINRFDPITAPESFRHYSGEEINKVLDNALKTVKASFISDIPNSVTSIDGLNKLVTTGRLDGITYNKIIKSLTNQIPTDILNSIQQESDAVGLGIDQGNFLNEDGSLNRSTRVGSLIHGKGVAGEQIIKTSKNQISRRPLPRSSSKPKSKIFNKKLKEVPISARGNRATKILEGYIEEAQTAFSKNRSNKSINRLSLTDSFEKISGLSKIEFNGVSKDKPIILHANGRRVETTLDGNLKLSTGESVTVRDLILQGLLTDTLIMD